MTALPLALTMILSTTKIAIEMTTDHETNDTAPTNLDIVPLDTSIARTSPKSTVRATTNIATRTASIEIRAVDTIAPVATSPVTLGIVAVDLDLGQEIGDEL